MRETRAGRIVFAAALALLGAFTLAWPDFMGQWRPLPAGLPLRHALVAAVGVVLLVGGFALLATRRRRPAALTLAALLLALLLAFQAPGLVSHPLVEGRWEDVGESVMLIAGAWTIFSLTPGGPLARLGSARAGRIAFALALIPIGLSHFFYLGETAPLIPAWLPFHVALAWLTGAAHIAAGLALLSGVLARLAARLEAVMTSAFTLIVWVPAVIALPARTSNWSELFVSAAIAGAAWAVAGGLSSKKRG